MIKFLKNQDFLCSNLLSGRKLERIAIKHCKVTMFMFKPGNGYSCVLIFSVTLRLISYKTIRVHFADKINKSSMERHVLIRKT